MTWRPGFATLRTVGHVDVNSDLSFSLPDGRPLLNDVSLRVGEGTKTALIGANGTGKTTLSRIISGDLVADEGVITRSGNMGIMRQFVGQVRDESTVRDLLVSAAPPGSAAAPHVDAAELAMMEHDDRAPPRWPTPRPSWTGATPAGTTWETVWDEVCTVAAPRPALRPRAAPPRRRSLSGGEQKRLVLEALLRGPDEALLLDEPDNYLDVPGKRWLEAQLVASTKTVFFISHDRELLNNAAGRIVTLEPGGPGPGSGRTPARFASYARRPRGPQRPARGAPERWDEEHVKLKALVQDVQGQGHVPLRHGHPRYHAAQTRLPRSSSRPAPPRPSRSAQNVKMRLKGGRTAKRAIVCPKLDLEVDAPGDS